MRKWIRAGSIFILALSLLAGCGKQFEVEEAGGTKVDEDLIVVGVSQLGSESVWRSVNTQSIQNVFTKENGYLLIFDNARQKQENQIKAIRSFISQRVDYIVFSPITEEGWDTVLMEAKEAGIPVILVDRDLNSADDSLYTTRVGSDFEAEGEKAGTWLAEYLEQTGRSDEEINIVVLQGTEGATPTIGRTEGFWNVAKQYDNWNIVDQTDAEFTTAKAREEMTRILQENPDIDVIVSQNDDMTFGALEVAEQFGKTTGVDGDIIVISFDAVRSAVEMVKDGKINVDIECNPEQGEYIEDVIRKIENGEPVEKAYYVPEQIITQENAEQYLEERDY